MQQETAFWIGFNDATFYVSVVVIGFCVSMAVSYSSDVVKSFRVCLCSSVVTGFLSFVCVGFLVGRDSDGLTGHIWYLALSAFIGMAGKYQAKIIETIAKRTGLLDDTDEIQ